MASGYYRFDNFAYLLDQYRIDILLIFLLIFVIVYAILQKTKILGEAKKNLNVVVALVVGLLVIVPSVTGKFPPNADPVKIISEALPSVSIVLVAIIFLLILIGVFGQEQVFLGLSMPGWVAFFSFVTIVIIFGGAAGWWSGYFGETIENIFGAEGIAVVIMLLVFGLIIAWVTSEPKQGQGALTLDFSKLFGKGGGGGGH
ncbi:hypothetical protein HY637_00645 [Candidatus Woesearchaeota archaeon]|nr:hypothetical protein [Candidatus Woesearchaeota archaeon]